MFNVKLGLLAKYLGRNATEEKDANFVVVVNLRPKSFGEIKLPSRDPFVNPIIQPNYFSHPDDMRVLVDGNLPNSIRETYLNPVLPGWTHIIYQYFFYCPGVRQTSYRRINARLIENHLPGCEHEILKSDAYYECYIRHFTFA
jgi:choline dehydrogenase